MKITKQNLVKKLGLTKEEAEFYIEMMELIPIEEDGKVSGRKLYEVLGVSSNFTTWIKRMIAYGFTNNVDYTTFWSDSKNGNAVECVGSSQKMSALGYELAYVLSLDMAKHVAMIQRTEIGMKLRTYFILNERIVHAILSWEEERNENKKYCKEMKKYYKNTFMDTYGKEPTPNQYAQLQNSVYIVAFNMTAKELKEKLDIKYNYVVPDWVEEEINKALDFVYQRFAYMIDDGELDLDVLIQRGAKVFDKRYEMPFEI